MEEFKTINKNAVAEITEKRSRFIAHIFYIENVEEAEKNIKKIRKDYHDAKHNCFAYAIETGDGGIAIKFNDDGEPSGTAGAPILKTILAEGLSNVLVVVTRYFGGTLLGTGGLVRAYTEVTKKALKETEEIVKIKGYEVSLIVEYSEIDKIKYFSEKNKIKIKEIKYLENIEIIIEISESLLNVITNNTIKTDFKILKCDILKEKYIKK